MQPVSPQSNTPARKVLVTSGPTRAYIDSIRYFANTSSGALGAKIVEELVSHNIPVVHLFGTGSARPQLDDTDDVEFLEIRSVPELADRVKAVCGRGDIGAVIHAMAVLDYVPETTLGIKKKSGDDTWDLRLVRTPKVSAIIRDMLPDVFFVGFKLEVDVSENELIDRAAASLESYNLNAVVANDLNRVSGDRHEALILGPEREILARCVTKVEIAEEISNLLKIYM